MCLDLLRIDERRLDRGSLEGFEYEIVHNLSGYRCGYLRVTLGHPWFGKDYNDIDVDVHGGLTFSERGKACTTHDGKDEWWVGFDCAHAFDAPDLELMSPDRAEYYKRNPIFHRTAEEHVRSTAYVKVELQKLVQQASVACGSATSHE